MKLHSEDSDSDLVAFAFGLALLGLVELVAWLCRQF